MRIVRLLLAAVLITLSVQTGADEPYIPAELEDWQEWVLHDRQMHRCPILNDQKICLWPGRLELVVTSSGGRFSQNVEVVANEWFVLPGDKNLWPLDVTVDGVPVAVIERNSRPALRLTPGTKKIEGEFLWQRTPDTLALGNGTGLLSLTVNGRAIERPRWNQRTVWISQGSTPTEQQNENQLDVSVYRYIEDGAPALMYVKLILEISGESREEVIGQLVPDTFEPMHMQAPLPARLDDQGMLTIQARPGSYEFVFQARLLQPLSLLEFNPSGPHWPVEEVWSYQESARLRATEVSAVNPVDPVQAGVPDEWQEAPAYKMGSGDVLRVVELQRGRSANEKNRLVLNRNLWLDFDRGGYTARDQVTGEMLQSWRLNMAYPFELQSVRQNQGESGNLLVTKLAQDDGQSGVEIRTPSVNITAFSRLESSDKSLLVGGWDARFDQVSTLLFLPPGHRLLTASGADHSSNTWFSKWNLLDFFVLLIVAVALWRLHAPWLGIVALIALTLSMHEPGAPTWSWLNLLAAFAAVKYLPKGRLLTVAHIYKIASIAIVVLLLLPFAANQLRYAAFPQLEPKGYYTTDYAAAPAPVAMDESIGNSADSSLKQSRRSYSERNAIEEVVVTASKGNVFSRYDKNARVQAGPGEPSWSWHRYQLRWSGPIDTEQTTQLWIVSPWLMTTWRVAMIGLLLVLLGTMVKSSVASGKLKLPKTGIASILLAMFFVGFMVSVPSQAQTPDPQLLEQLRERLLEADECIPKCVNLSRAKLTYTPDALSVELMAHVQSRQALLLPGRAGNWMPDTIVVNGKAHERMRLANNNGGLIFLEPGVHRIGLQGPLPNANSVVIGFPLTPKYVDVSGDGWEVTGVDQNRISGGAITLIRQQTGRDRSSLDAIDVEQFPAFVKVYRTLRFDLDWSVETTVVRSAPRTAAINLRIPLLEGESVTSDSVVVKEGYAQVTIPTGMQRISWASNLDRVPQMTLSAPSEVPWQEIWSIETGASWRLVHRGVPELNAERGQDATWVARFMPWPQEKLDLILERPTAIAGETLAIDTAKVNYGVGRRSGDAELTFSYRATRGGQHAIKLPAGSELTSVNIDGQSQNIALQENLLRLPLVPGQHNVSVSWRAKQQSLLRVSGQEVDLGMAASNLTSRMTIPRNRWVLWTNGPRLGPAVLYWSELLVLIAVAFVLARFANTPLKFWHWLLLGLGFSTFFWPAFMIVTGAILALAWRERSQLSNHSAFNARQIFLGLLVGAAALALVTTIPYGLLGSPNMHVSGNNSSAFNLNWFVDRSEGLMPQGSVISAPLWVYKGLILIWALWLAFALLKWIPWMWQAYSKGGIWQEAKVIVEAEPAKGGEPSQELPDER